MSTERCETCEHWSEHDYPKHEMSMGEDALDPTLRWGLCEFIAHGGARRKRDDHGTYVDLPASKRAFAMDASDYHGSLHTRHDFGCIEHTRRATPEEPTP